MGPLFSSYKSIKITLYIIHIHIHYTLHVSDTLQVSRNQFKLYMMTIIYVYNIVILLNSLYIVTRLLRQGCLMAETASNPRLSQSCGQVVTTK